jgi:hypothetical protein
MKQEKKKKKGPKPKQKITPKSTKHTMRRLKRRNHET